jgi:hypothetical protein
MITADNFKFAEVDLAELALLLRLKSLVVIFELVMKILHQALFSKLLVCYFFRGIYSTLLVDQVKDTDVVTEEGAVFCKGFLSSLSDH